MKANTYEQVLYTIPQEFSVDLLLGMEENFIDVDTMSWTVAEYMDIVRSCGGMEILSGKYVADIEIWAKALITTPVLERNLDYYADEEQARGTRSTSLQYFSSKDRQPY